MIRLSIAIQHHPRRTDIVGPLLAALPGAELATDPDPTGKPSPWRTYRHALETTPIRATHRLIVQDDVVPCAGFHPAAIAALTAKPHRLVTFFVGGNPYEHARALRDASDRGSQWAELDTQRFCPVVCTAWPVELIHPFLAYVDAQHWPEQFTADDEMVGRFCQHHEHVPLATVPSLVDHPDDVPSLLGNKAMYGQDSGRTVSCWIGDCDPASIDWTLGP